MGSDAEILQLHHSAKHHLHAAHTQGAAPSVGRYPSDDINKFLWMVRIGGGEFPEIKERDYIGDGSYRVDNKVTKVCGHFRVKAVQA